MLVYKIHSNFPIRDYEDFFCISDKTKPLITVNVRDAEYADELPFNIPVKDESGENVCWDYRSSDKTISMDEVILVISEITGVPMSEIEIVTHGKY